MTAAPRTAIVASVTLVLALLMLPGVLSGAASPEAPAVMLEKGIYQEETAGDLDAAMKIYKTILDEARTDRKFVAQAQYRLGMCNLKKGQNRQAIAAMHELVAAYGDQKDLVAKAQKCIAQAQGKMSPQEVADIVGAAVTTISTCAETDPRVAPALATLSGLDSVEVVKALAKHLASDQNTIRRAAIYVLWKADLPDVAGAVADLEKLCSHEEDLTRGMAALTLGGRKVASSLPVLTKMTLEDTSGNARRCAAYALGLMGLGEARATLQKALADKDPMVRNNAEAARSFEKCLAVAPKVAGALNGLGWIAKGQGRPDEAMSYWRKAIAADPRASTARAGLAAIFMERGEFDFAEKEYQAALLADPTDAAAKTALATVAKAREAVKAAKAAAEAWLVLLDAGEYGQTYDQASALVKKVTTKAAWESTVKSAVTALGKPGPRKVISATYMTAMPGAPDGEYVIVQFRTPYEKKKDAVETVTPMKDTDGKWRVSGYYVR